MSRAIAKVIGLGTLLVALVAAPLLPARIASAAAGNPAYCNSNVPRLTNQNIGSEVPVIMVHGFNGHPSDWGSISDPSSFAGAVNNIPGVAVADLYGYNTYAWVDNPSNGPRLAQTIDCVSQLSVHSGGKGMVIVVGYSMGGLVARDALSRHLADGRSVADVVGQAITIGTPHTGTVNPYGPFATGSAAINNIPHFPSQTIVHTIAGDVTHIIYDQQGNEIQRIYPSDDTLVSTDSAHDNYRYDSDPAIGGGKKTFSCQKKYTMYSFFGIAIAQGVAPCEHGQLIQNAANGVRGDTIDAITKYVAYLNKPAGVSLTVGSLTATFDSRWTGVDYGASGPGQDGSGTDTTNGAACTNCTDVPPPTVYAFADLTNMSWCNGALLDCMVDPSQVIGPAPSVTVGGRTPDSSARYYDSGYKGTSMVWCFNTEKVCVDYRRAVDTPQLEPSQAVIDLFNNATWSN